MTAQATSNADESPEAGSERLILRPKTLLPRLQPEYDLTRFPATIGRHRDNDVELPFDSVSRYHARIELADGSLKVADLRSSNGTFVNGKRVQKAALLDQDVLKFGSIEFTVSRPREGEQPGARVSVPEPGTETMVHFVQEDKEVVESVVEAEIHDDTSRIVAIEEEITDKEQFRRAKERLVTFYKLNEALRATTDEKRLLQRVLALLFQVLPVERGAVLTRDGQDSGNFNPVAIQVRSQSPSADDSIGISKTILSKCVKDKVAILTTDASADNRFASSESIIMNKTRSAMCVPLISFHHVFGAIFVDTTNSIRAFNKEDLQFLANIGAEVAIHLHNLRMLQEKIRTERMAAIGQTITGMAHNIKNVLLLSQGGMELMGKRLEEKSYDAVPDTWGLVKRGIDRINTMVKDMLDYARARKVEKRRCQVNDLLKEIKETFAEELSKRGVECELDLDPKCPAVMIDVDGLDKAIVNLLLNAAEACPEGNGHVRLRTEFQMSDACLYIDVEDNAGGIPAEILPRIFTPFFTTKGAKGSGLGLAMTKKFIEDMGGQIEIETEEGKGTRFRITIVVEDSIRLEPTPLPPTRYPIEG